MATAASVGDTAAAQKKRPRLNPARRKSAKAKEHSQTAPAAAGSVARTIDANDVQAKKPNTTAVIKSKPSALPATKQKPSFLTPSPKTGGVPLPAAALKPLPQKSTKQDAGHLAAPAFVTGGLIDDSITSMRAGTYSSVDALDMLRRTTLAYAMLVPGGVPFVERMFREVDMVRKQRGHEVDKVVAEASAELAAASKRGAGPDELQSIILSNLVKLSHFAGTATQDIVARNPHLSPYQASAAKALRPPPQTKTPTVKLNMSIKQRSTAAA